MGKKRQLFGGGMEQFYRIYYTSELNVFFHIKYLEKKSDPEYYKKEIKRLNSKARKAYNRRKLGVH
jgi:hypothetical protein